MELNMILPQKMSTGYLPNLPEILNQVKNEDGANMFTMESAKKASAQPNPEATIQYIDVDKL